MNRFMACFLIASFFMGCGDPEEDVREKLKGKQEGAATVETENADRPATKGDLKGVTNAIENHGDRITKVETAVTKLDKTVEDGFEDNNDLLREMLAEMKKDKAPSVPERGALAPSSSFQNTVQEWAQVTEGVGEITTNVITTLEKIDKFRGRDYDRLEQMEGRLNSRFDGLEERLEAVKADMASRIQTIIATELDTRDLRAIKFAEIVELAVKEIRERPETPALGVEELKEVLREGLAPLLGKMKEVKYDVNWNWKVDLTFHRPPTEVLKKARYTYQRYPVYQAGPRRYLCYYVYNSWGGYTTYYVWFE